MPATGYIQVRAYTSDAQYPLRNVAITVTSQDGTAIAMRLTDRSGRSPPSPFPYRIRQKASLQSRLSGPTPW